MKSLVRTLAVLFVLASAVPAFAEDTQPAAGQAQTAEKPAAKSTAKSTSSKKKTSTKKSSTKKEGEHAAPAEGAAKK